MTFASDATDPMNLDFDNISETDLFSFLKGLDEPEVVSKNLSPEDSKLESKLKEQIVKESQEFFKKYKKYIFRYFPKVFLMRENFLALMTPEDISNYLEEIIKILRFEPWKYVESPFKLINTQLSDEEKKVWASVGYDTKYLETIADPKKLKKVSRDGAGFWEFIADQLSFYAEFIERVRVDSKDNSIYLEKRNSSYWDSGYYGGFGAYGAKPKQDKSADLKLKEYWKNNKNTQLKAMMSGCKNQKPNKLEKEMITIIKDLNLPYKFVGDWQVVFGGRNPDFINVNGHKKLIEVFGTYWHTTRARTFTDTEEGRIKHFKKYGFDCLVIWDTEFKNKDMLIEKLKIFEGGELS